MFSYGLVHFIFLICFFDAQEIDGYHISNRWRGQRFGGQLTLHAADNTQKDSDSFCLSWKKVSASFLILCNGIVGLSTGANAQNIADAVRFNIPSVVIAGSVSDSSDASAAASAAYFIDGNIQMLKKEVQFVLKTFPDFVKRRDFLGLNQMLKQKRLVDMRSTVGDLENFLPDAVDFDQSYDKLQTYLNERVTSQDPSSDQLEVQHMVDDVLDKFDRLMRSDTAQWLKAAS